jgi:hypothetical protein
MPQPFVEVVERTGKAVRFYHKLENRSDERTYVSLEANKVTL